MSVVRDHRRSFTFVTFGKMIYLYCWKPLRPVTCVKAYRLQFCCDDAISLSGRLGYFRSTVKVGYTFKNYYRMGYQIKSKSWDVVVKDYCSHYRPLRPATLSSSRKSPPLISGSSNVAASCEISSGIFCE
jgi:hypothetical protein